MTDAAEARLREIEREILARRPEHSIEPSLGRIKALTALLGDPQHAYPVVHITGTNGKTSTARMADTLLRARGLRTGLFTSPHLTSMRERICVDGEPLSAERFVQAYDEIWPYLELVDQSQPVRLSFFEVFVGMAFSVFADAPVDVAVIEVGMGGTWDNTNVADGTVAIVTPISVDHARHLGSTVEQIAADKAGIIKPGAIAVLAEQPAGAMDVLLERAEEVGATVAREGAQFGVVSRELAVGGQVLDIRGLLGDYDGLFLPLFGAHQAGNAACALAAVEAFAGAAPISGYQAGREGVDGAAPRSGYSTGGHDVGAGGGLDAGGGPGGAAGGGSGGAPPVIPWAVPGPLGGELVRQAFGAMSSPGRLEIVRRSPVVILDSAHNPAGMAASVAALTEAFNFAELIGVFAVSGDKDVPGILDQLEPVVAELVVTSNSSQRSMDAAKLADVAGGVFGDDRVRIAARLDQAIELGVTLADEAAAARDAGGGAPGSVAVLITGSVITAGDARLLLAPADGGGG
jgi:dihydrofolate synthase/folylpolyglutamate synthase